MNRAPRNIEAYCRQAPISPDCEDWAGAPVCRMPEEFAEPLTCSGEHAQDPCSAQFSGDFLTVGTGLLGYALARYGAMPLSQRLECASRRFEGMPFVVDPLGEGASGPVDEDPLVSFEAVDCMTYVEEVMALSSGAQDFAGFLGELSDIRYLGGLGTFGARRHFVSADWLPENAAHGRVADITVKIGGNDTKRISITIDRHGWLEGRSDLAPARKTAAHRELLEVGKHGAGEASLDYIPASLFLDENAGPKIVDVLPEISIAIFVRHQEAASKIGVIVGHMGFLVVPKKADGSRGTPMLRHASSLRGFVTEEPFLPYLESQLEYRAGVSVLEVADRAHR